GEAVGLQFDWHRVSTRTPFDAHQPLHVMAYFVRDDVRAREVARGAEALAELLKESKIEIHAAVLRTVERARRRLRHAARRVNRVTKHHDARGLVLPWKNALPRRLH